MQLFHAIIKQSDIIFNEKFNSSVPEFRQTVKLLLMFNSSERLRL